MVSIVIVSYNTRDLLKSCLESIYKNVQEVEFEVVVVDNASVDDSVEMIRKNFKQATLIQNKDNEGFAKANNKAVAKAKGQYILFLNSDTTVTDDGISKMAKSFDEDTAIGILGGYLENKEGEVEKSYGKYFNIFSVFAMLFLGTQERVSILHDKIKDVDWVNGASMMIRRDLFKKLGGFDEHFFMYVEDMELCLRAKKAGFRICISNQAKILHLGQGSSNRSFAIVLIYKGILYFFKKHKNPLQYGIVKFMLVIKAGVAIMYGYISGNEYLINTYKRAIRF